MRDLTVIEKGIAGPQTTLKSFPEKIVDGYKPKDYEKLDVNVSTNGKPYVVPLFRNPRNFEVMYYSDLFRRRVRDTFFCGDIEKAKEIFENAVPGSFEYLILDEDKTKKKIQEAIEHLTTQGLTQNALELAKLSLDHGINLERFQEHGTQKVSSKTVSRLIKSAAEKDPLNTCRLLTSAIKSGLSFEYKEIAWVASLTVKNSRGKENIDAFAELLMTAIDHETIPKDNYEAEFLSIALYILSIPEIQLDEGEKELADVAYRSEYAFNLGKKIIEENFPIYKLQSNQQEGINSLIQNLRYTSRRLAALHLQYVGSKPEEVSKVLPRKPLKGYELIVAEKMVGTGEGILRNSNYLIDCSLVLTSMALCDYPAEKEEKPSHHPIRMDTLVNVMEEIRNMKQPVSGVPLSKEYLELVYHTTALAIQRFLPHREARGAREVDKPFSDLIHAQVEYFLKRDYPEYAVRLAVKADDHGFPFKLDTLEKIHVQVSSKPQSPEFDFDLQMLRDIIDEKENFPELQRTSQDYPEQLTGPVTVEALQKDFDIIPATTHKERLSQLIKDKNPVVRATGFGRLTDKVIQKLRQNEKTDEALNFGILCLENGVFDKTQAAGEYKEAKKTFETLACIGHRSDNQEYKLKAAILLTHALRNGINIKREIVLNTAKELENISDRPEHVIAHIRLAAEAAKRLDRSDFNATLFFNITLENGSETDFICGEKNLAEVYNRFKELHKLALAVVERKYPFHILKGEKDGVKYQERIQQVVNRFLNLSFKLRLWDEYLKTSGKLSPGKVQHSKDVFKGDEFQRQVVDACVDGELNLKDKEGDLVKAGVQLFAQNGISIHRLEIDTIASLFNQVRINKIAIDEEMQKALQDAVVNIPSIVNKVKKEKLVKSLNLFIEYMAGKSDDTGETKRRIEVILSIIKRMSELELYVDAVNKRALRNRIAELEQSGVTFEGEAGKLLDEFFPHLEKAYTGEPEENGKGRPELKGGIG